MTAVADFGRVTMIQKDGGQGAIETRAPLPLGKKAMRDRLRLSLMAIIAVFPLASTSFGQGSAHDAKAMLVKAVAAVKADKAKALDMFQ
jgi:hypothetical protein